MKPYRVKHTMTQEYLVFAESREQAIEDCDYNFDYDMVVVNDDTFAQGDVVDGNTTAVSLGDNALVIFRDTDWEKAKEVYESDFKGRIYLDTYEDGLVLIQNYSRGGASLV